MLEFFFLRKHRVGTICLSTQKDIGNKEFRGVFFFFSQRSTLPLHWSDRWDNLSARKHTFSQSTFTLTPAHRYWIKPCSKGKTGRWINPVLLDLIHGYAEWMLRQPITGQLAWLAWCGTSYRGFCHPMGSIHFHPPLWTEGEHSPTGQTWKGILAIKINTPNSYFRVELKQYFYGCFHAIWCLTSQR